MVWTAGYTVAEIREFVHQYELQPYGQKASWLAERGVSSYRFRVWRNGVYGGDLDRGLFPRDSSGMVIPRRERTALERERARERAEHEAEVARLIARVQELEASNGTLGKANDALGKAIGLLQAMSEREPDAKTMTEPENSSPPRTNSSSS